MRKAKIVCTIGPSTNNSDTIRKLIENGMDVARLNYSHGGCKVCENSIRLLREASKECGKPIPIICDLKGIKIRLTKIEEGSFPLKKGQKIALAPGSDPSTPELLQVSYPALVEDVEINQNIFIDDGTIRLEVREKRDTSIIAEVMMDATLKSNKGVNLPQTEITMDTFTELDKTDLADSLEAGIDFIATSFVRNADDLIVMKEWAAKQGLKAPRIIAKIERPEAVLDIDAILEEVEGIMVARGDLGCESLPEEVPIFQKILIEKANRRGKFVIVATQMMESMISNTRPTRAEASDVANAVLDGCDALMLAAETAAGNYPVETVRMMNRIITHTEAEMAGKITSQFKGSGMLTAEAMAYSACSAAKDIRAKAIISFTKSGLLTELIAKFRPAMPVISITDDSDTWQRLSLAWGVVPLVKKGEYSIGEVEAYLIDEGIASPRDRIIIVASSSFLGKRNTMRIHQLGMKGEAES